MGGTESPASFVLLGIWKFTLAAVGLDALRTKALAAFRHDGALEIANARLWLWCYVVMQFVDSVQATRQKFDWTSLLHHVASGIGFALDAACGTDRTTGLAVMALAGEAVAPFYQVYFWLRSRGLGATAQGKIAIRGVVLCTLLVRMPLALFLGAVVCRDTWRTLVKGVVAPELQPWLMVPAACGVQLILYLDMIWMRKWAFPKLRRPAISKEEAEARRKSEQVKRDQ